MASVPVIEELRAEVKILRADQKDYINQPVMAGLLCLFSIWETSVVKRRFSLHEYMIANYKGDEHT